jgi:hypothetical protein
MSDHEFYAEPTVFDQWHASIGGWLCTRMSGLCPYRWVIGFGLLGSVFLVTSMVVLAVTLGSSAGSTTLLWNDSMAQGLTVLVGLTATQTLFRLALDAWPADTRLPSALRRVGHYVGWRQTENLSVTKRTPRVVKFPRSSAPQPTAESSDQQAVQEFFSGVRAAGINVAIAKALFGAGIRSPRHLLEARDEQLFAIHGVGPATVRKLRAQFKR